MKQKKPLAQVGLPGQRRGLDMEPKKIHDGRLPLTPVGLKSTANCDTVVKSAVDCWLWLTPYIATKPRLSI